MADYASGSDLQSFAEEPGALGSSASWDLLASAASRIFDRLTEVSDDFYQAATGTPAARTFYGDGTAYLRLDPFVGTPTPVVAIPGGEYSVAATDFVVQGQSLVFLSKTRGVMQVYGEFPNYNRFTGWYDAVAVQVTADWGFAEVPDEVKYAVIQIGLMLWRQREPAAQVTSTIDGIMAMELPPMTRGVVDKYRETYSKRALFA